MSRNKYKEKAMSAVNKLKSNLKGKLYEMADIPSVSVKQLSEFIRQHPDTQITKKELLGNTYTFYRLNANDDFLYMETINERILQLDGSSHGKRFVSYRSYRDSQNLNTPMRLT
ncbi:hypothetical protein [Cytobacillus firmus]|uniref:hypothetical protein n=1 Tax=Cytobacillus firmus TaxID=1399 RepID=UPI00064EFAA5|nr:hypothetical protein [Cytobacillus firmus]KML41168.1 hypothetical protein VL14_11880 [Cytobacillus firmus]